MTAVEGTKSGFGWKDGLVVQAIRNGGVLVLDEYNRLKGEARAAFHQVYDAVLRNKGEVILTENGGEVVPLHPDFRMVLTQNPPDGTFTNREVIDPAELSRVVHLRYPAQLPPEIEEARILGSFGLKPETTYIEPEVLPDQLPLAKSELAAIPGMTEILGKFVEFHRHLRQAIETRKLGADCAQPVHLTFQRDVKRMFTFVSHYYNGDINDTFAQAIEFYFVNRFESELERQKVREAARLVEYSDGKKSKRFGLNAGVEQLLGKNFYGPDVCKEFFDTKEIGEVPPIPSFITPTLLASPCPHSSDGKTIAETHSLVFIPSQIGTKQLSVHAFSQLGNQKCTERGWQEIIPNPSWFVRTEFVVTATDGRWVLVLNEGIQSENFKARDAYDVMNPREMILSRAIIGIASKGNYQSTPAFNVLLRVSNIFCEMKSSGLTVGFDNGSRLAVQRSK